MLEAATGTARELGHRFVGTEHLLLALFSEPADPAAGGGLAAEVLAELGLDRTTARAKVVETLSGYRS